MLNEGETGSDTEKEFKIAHAIYYEIITNVSEQEE